MASTIQFTDEQGREWTLQPARIGQTGAYIYRLIDTRGNPITEVFGMNDDVALTTAQMWVAEYRGIPEDVRKVIPAGMKVRLVDGLWISANED